MTKPNPCKRCGNDAFVKKLHDGSYYITCERCVQAVGALYRMEVRSDKESDGTLGWNAMNPVAEPEGTDKVNEYGQEPPEQELCGTCRFFNGDFCYRFPPVFVGSNSDGDSVWDRPAISRHGYCGEWRAK